MNASANGERLVPKPYPVFAGRSCQFLLSWTNRSGVNYGGLKQACLNARATVWAELSRDAGFPNVRELFTDPSDIIESLLLPAVKGWQFDYFAKRLSWSPPASARIQLTS